MGWLKRNLFFVIGGVLALGLLGAAGFYVFKSWQRNAADFDQLNKIYSTLQSVSREKPSPGNAKVDNTATAHEQEKQIREWIRQAHDYFQPIEPIPDSTNGPISNEAFADALHRTIDDLQREAVTANVQLPPQYAFSFAAEKDKVRFDPNSIAQLAGELGEIKAISEAFFTARVNALEGIQRVRVSDDDASGPASDYMNDQPAVNDLAVLTPYEVTFRGFSAEIAQVFDAFASSPHGFIIKSINVFPISANSSLDGGGGPMSTEPMPGAMPGAMTGKGALQTMLNEQMLRVTLVIDVVKLTPKN